MPSIDDIFPDKWLKASHLIMTDGRRPIIPVTVRGAGVEQLHNPKTNQKEPRLVIEFEGKDKRLILNKTQATAIAEITHARDYTRWRGARLAIQAGIAPNKKDTILILSPTPAQAQGDHNPNPNPDLDTGGSGHKAQGDPDPNPFD
jgi:hypothetical protein